MSFLPVVASARIGFDARLEMPPTIIAPYEKTEDRFSVAMKPKSYPLLSYSLSRDPIVQASSWDDQTIRFGASYYNRNGIKGDYIPVAVDAQEYYNWRIERWENRTFSDLATEAMIDPEARNRRAGLGFSVALPKRLDRIFGEGGAGLTVTGFRRITFAGRSQWNDQPNTPGNVQSKFPSLSMDQISRFEITGTIGTKITVKVSQDSQTDIPLANRLQLRYKGDDDDVLQEVEAGNTTLQIPNTQFAGYSQRIQGLFGLKARAQIGALSLTAIASQEKASSERASISAQGEEEAAEIIRDDEYVERRIFDLMRDDELRPNELVTEVYVYEQISEQANSDQTTAAFRADAYYFFDINTNQPIPDPGDNDAVDIQVVEVNQDNYELRQDRTGNYLAFRSSASTQRVLAVYMVVTDTLTNTTREVGDISRTQDGVNHFHLKMIFEGGQRPDDPTWELMWRNTYRLPRGLAMEDIDVKIYKGLAGAEALTSTIDYQVGENGNSQGFYLSILGLDQEDSRGNPRPDNKIDKLPSIIDTALGLLVFPQREPFAYEGNFGNQPPLAETVPTIYDYNSPTEKKEASQYFLRLITKTRSSIIRLNRANIIEGSEIVTLNGRRLTRGDDYRIDYNFGQVTLQTDEALDPNADVDVSFEYAPFFSLAKKTLFGMRGEYEWSENLKFGTTVLYKSDKAQDRKPRVGQETSEMMVLDADMDWRVEPSFMTTIADALPFVSTEARSTFNFSAEVAQSRPNPNTENIAYIDDFESAEDQVSIGFTRSSWQLSSPPTLILDSNFVKGVKIIWHSLRDPIPVADVWNRESAAGEGSFRPFRIISRPDSLSIDTTLDIIDTSIVTTVDTTYWICSAFDSTGDTCIDYTVALNPEQADTFFVEVSADTLRDTLIIAVDTVQSKSWNGITSYLGRNRIDASRVQLFEIRTNARRGTIHFDFGEISDDINGDGQNNTEDPSGLNIVLDENDVGLDGVPDSLESNKRGGYDPVTNPDPHGDNWYFDGFGTCPLPLDLQGQCDADSNYYEWLNGTEGNRIDPIVQGRPDEEKRGITFNRVESYFSFEVDFGDSLSDSTFLVRGSEWPRSDSIANPPNGFWRTWRIPIRVSDLVDSVNAPDWTNVTHARVWFEHEAAGAQPETLLVASWGFIQANWNDTTIYGTVDSSTVFAVASISEEDGTFSPPAGVDAYTDPTTNVTESQRGLLLTVQNLSHQDSVIAQKDLFSVEQYSGYQTLEMFVYGDIPLELEGKVQLFFRLGRDANNWYEYYTPIYRGWDERNLVRIRFDEVTQLKDSVLQEAGPNIRVVDSVVSNDRYRVLGAPNLNEIRYFATGLVNTDSGQSVSADIWLDELRLTDVRRDVGMAGRFTVGGTMADLLNYSFSFRSQDPFYRNVSSATRGGSADNLGSGRSQTDYNYQISLNFDKFLPRSWNAKVPIRYSFSKAETVPLLRNNSDIVLPDELREQEKSTSESMQISVSESFNIREGNPIFSLLLNRLKTNYSYRRSTQSTPNRPYSLSEAYNVRGSFDLSPRVAPTLSPLTWLGSVPILKKVSATEIGLYPSSWRVSASFDRNLTISEDISDNRTSSISRDMQGQVDVSYSLFQNLSATYSLDSRRDLSDLERVSLSFSDWRLGVEINHRQSFGAGYDPGLLNFLSTRFSYKSTYGDTWDRGSNTRAGSMQNSWGVSGTFDHIQLFGGRGSGGAGGRRPTRRTGSDRRAGAQADEDDGTAFYEYPLVALRFLTGWISPLNYTYGQQYTSRTPGMEDRPSLEYRFGLTRDLGVDQNRSTVGNNTASQSLNYDVSSGFTLFGGVRTDVGYSRNINEDIVRQGTLTRQISTGWPELNVRISEFTWFPLLKPVLNKFISIFSPRTGFSRQVRASENIGTDIKTSEEESLNFNPLLSVNLNLLRNLSLAGSYAISQGNRKTFNINSGDLQKESRSTRKTITVTSKYSFSAPGGISLPLLGKLKFQSQVTINTSVKINETTTDVSDAGGPFNPSDQKSDFSVSTDVAYNFSRQIRGGVTGSWRDSTDELRNRNDHFRELRIWAELSF